MDVPSWKGSETVPTVRPGMVFWWFLSKTTSWKNTVLDYMLEVDCAENYDASEISRHYFCVQDLDCIQLVVACFPCAICVFFIYVLVLHIVLHVERYRRTFEPLNLDPLRDKVESGSPKNSPGTFLWQLHEIPYSF